MENKGGVWAGLVAWSVEEGGIRIADGGRGAAAFLEYPEAAIWDFALRGIPEDRAVVMLAAIAAIAPAPMDVDAARALYRRTIKKWIAAHWIEERGESVEPVDHA